MPWDLVKRMVPIALNALDNLIGDGVLDRHELENDPLTELEMWDEVIVQRLPPSLVVTPSATLGKECSVAGTYYDPTDAVRAIIAVAESGSIRRDAFTALHELGHHIQHTTPEIADELADLPVDITFAVEDRVCEEFAAAILIPNTTATTILGTDTPTAGDIVTLTQRTSASRSAVCIRAHENLTVPGMVVLLDADDRVQIAPARGLPPLRRGSTQSSAEIVKKARRRQAEGDYDFRITDDDTRFQYRDAIEGASLFAQVADIGGGYLVIVAVTENPPWRDRFTLPKFDTAPRAADWVCPHPECGEPFESWAETHDLCGKPRCTSCHRCACSPSHVKERVCKGCNLMQPNHRFEDDGATHCNDCA
ncbi:ImmA/IrrE family metallo-endopeptidase [Kribbella speibonae]|uniref:ImmA/IrrE family metallo-endopeptidase n=1 Tax=Kribbella speibonae TaxID=1572660 RepID=A0A4R0J1H0_9ACTN|nr:ImmA/IrrE family metallo-endopeptidase [Kribbella speibonae]TCC38884.1 ImmA/IrrE family metallo-endopeptidase [Kribbella speibonae]